MTVAITRADMDAAGLLAAGASKDAAASRRILGLALVMDGQTRAAAARAVGMDRQTLRDWVHRYNERGLKGLHNTPCRGAPPRKLTVEQEAAVAQWVRQGPSREKIVRWRLVDLRDQIGREFGVALHERTVGKLMARLNFLLCRAGHRGDPGACAQQAHRAVVARRTQGGSAGQPDLRLGREGQPTAGAARPALRVGLFVRRGPSGARDWRRAGAAQHRRGGDEPASGRDQPLRRTERACGHHP